jgi:hypothetical protein
MIYNQWNGIVGLAVKQLNKYSVYVSNGLEFDDSDKHIWSFVRREIAKLYPDVAECQNVWSDLIHGGLFSFDTEDACYKFYRIFEQELTDSSAIYACTYNPDGFCETENT